MVRGLDVFREHLAGHADQYVLIGGTAATLAMEEAGLEFRATKELDIVLHIVAGRRQVDGLPWVGEDRLIPLKASAWLDLGERQAKGEPIDTKNIHKHANDVLRLSQLLAPDTRIPVAERIAQDLNRFLDAIETDRSIDPKSLKINSSVAEIAERIARAYGLSRRRAG